MRRATRRRRARLHAYVGAARCAAQHAEAHALARRRRAEASHGRHTRHAAQIDHRRRRAAPVTPVSPTAPAAPAARAAHAACAAGIVALLSCTVEGGARLAEDVTQRGEARGHRGMRRHPRMLCAIEAALHQLTRPA